MSNYTKTTNFTAKDALNTGDPNKVIKGSEHDTEFDNIATASATKANKVISGTTNGIIIQSASGDLVDGVQTIPTGTIVGTSDTQTLTNKTLTTCTMDVDNSTVTNIADAEIKTGANINAAKIGTGVVSNTEYNYLNGVTSAIQTQINAKVDSTAIDDLSGVTDPATARTNLGLGSLAVQSEVDGTDFPDAITGTYLEGNVAYRTGVQIGDTGAAFSKQLELKVFRGGTYNVRAGIAESLGGGGNTHIRIYVNGVAQGTDRNPVTSTAYDWVWYNEDITVSAGDLIQLYAHRGGSGSEPSHLAMGLLCGNPIMGGADYTDVYELNAVNGHLFTYQTT